MLLTAAAIIFDRRLFLAIIFQICEEPDRRIADVSLHGPAEGPLNNERGGEIKLKLRNIFFDQKMKSND